jgi:hypothetical protein
MDDIEVTEDLGKRKRTDFIIGSSDEEDSSNSDEAGDAGLQISFHPSPNMSVENGNNDDISGNSGIGGHSHNTSDTDEWDSAQEFDIDPVDLDIDMELSESDRDEDRMRKVKAGSGWRAPGYYKANPFLR